LLKEVLRLAASERVMQDSVIEASSEILSLNMHFQPRYRCDNCGFELKNLHWACPGCSCWGMVRPINNLIVAGPEPGMATTMD
jgi:lipopolysaccharide biosynthesis regulator YciM